jgi:hypothetical protein
VFGAAAIGDDFPLGVKVTLISEADDQYAPYDAFRGAPHFMERQ